MMQPKSPETNTRAIILAAGRRIMAQKGFSAVGLNEILANAGVPKGSFYHYFTSKDAFGEAVLSSYFDRYHVEMDAACAMPGLNMAERLILWWQKWNPDNEEHDFQERGLAVKLGAEVADLSEAMRLALKAGTERVIARLADALVSGAIEGSLTIDDDPRHVAASLYSLWLGASVMGRIVRTDEPFEQAMRTTQRTLGISTY
ncbi:TetR/AcrR family transcriptional regulator [Rhizobium sp. Leaf262]|uniref:TetR/AcrR family transcriptional regulator n=1 Tax=Rhizobium sp. Leaf262 TaxID=1736312 RepID=UPI00071389B7|nr:TetR family transcriptional regulator [Rhizobium sp. Leaf262]